MHSGSKTVRQLCNFALRPLSFNIITVCVLSNYWQQKCKTAMFHSCTYRVLQGTVCRTAIQTCRHTNIPPLIFLILSCNCDFLSLMPTYNQCALSIVKSDVNQLVKLTSVHRSRAATILKPHTDKSFHSYTQYHTMS